MAWQFFSLHHVHYVHVRTVNETVPVGRCHKILALYQWICKKKFEEICFKSLFGRDDGEGGVGNIDKIFLINLERDEGNTTPSTTHMS